MLLSTGKREAGKKGINKRLRREGKIPAIIYSKDQEPQHIFIDTRAFNQILSKLEKGFLPSTIFELEDESKNKIKAILKSIDYNITSYDVQHLDFLQLHDNQAVTIKIPITLEGSSDCVGVKEGGVLRQTIRHLKVKCRPKDIPANFTLCVRDVALNQSKRLAEVKLTENVKPLINLREVAVVVAKR